MKNILNITSSIKGDASTSIKLADAIVAKIQLVYPGSTVKTIDLAKKPLPHLEAASFMSFQIPPDDRTPEQQAAVHVSDAAVSDLMEADYIIIGVPFYNFGIPSTLKAWIDHVSRAGVTFSYSEVGPKGLVTGKKVFLAYAAGGVYSEGPMVSFDGTETYLRSFLGFLGMTDVTAFRAEGMMVPGLGENALPKAIEAVNEYAI